MKTLKYILLIAFAYMPVVATAQTSVKVLTRINNQSFLYSNEFLLEIDAEKADIKIETIESDSIFIELRQIVKNPSKEIAEKHLEAQKFTSDQSKDRLYLRNFILFDNTDKKSTSVFKNEYYIKVPKHCHIKIKNKLGNILVKEAKKSLRFDVEYGKITLNDCYGKLYANITLGELTVNRGTLFSQINTQNTRIKLLSPEGEIKGKCSFGSLSLVLLGGPVITDIKTNYCETTILNKSEGSYIFQIEANNGAINAPSYNIISEANKQILQTDDNDVGRRPIIKIVASENDINLY